MAAGDVDAKITSNNSRAGAFFDRVDDKITYSISQQPKTLSFWINPRIVDNQIIVVRNPANDYFGMRSAGYWSIYGDGSWSVTTANAIKDTWQHVAYVWAGTGYIVYLNGVAYETTTDPEIKPSEFGVSSNQTIPGALGDVKFWNRVLTTAEILKDYAGQPITDGLIHRWKLSKDYKDSVGTADGTNSGTFLAIKDDAIAAAIKTQRTTANDVYLMAGFKDNGQIVSAVIEEAP